MRACRTPASARPLSELPKGANQMGCGLRSASCSRCTCCDTSRCRCCHTAGVGDRACVCGVVPWNGGVGGATVLTAVCTCVAHPPTNRPASGALRATWCAAGRAGMTAHVPPPTPCTRQATRTSASLASAASSAAAAAVSGGGAAEALIAPAAVAVHVLLARSAAAITAAASDHRMAPCPGGRSDALRGAGHTQLAARGPAAPGARTAAPRSANQTKQHAARGLMGSYTRHVVESCEVA
jgi:hypothetical protein